MSDVTERAWWNRYQAIYQDILRHTATPIAPWHVVPADHKWFARVVIGSAIVRALGTLDLKFPRADKASLKEFATVRKALEAEGGGKRLVRKAAAK
jgi:Polyphosphate kinase 2 (PPK2)